MENHKLVLPQHLNQYGFLFGGDLLKWTDEYAWIAASQDYPGCNFVTIGLDKVEFRRNVKEGTILKFVAERKRTGNTSVQYFMNVFRGNSKDVEKDLIFSTNVTFVHVDEHGKKTQLPK
jgi:acyl-CoA hydrolase